jgi:hypothetical protein
VGSTANRVNFDPINLEDPINRPAWIACAPAERALLSIVVRPGNRRLNRPRSATTHLPKAYGFDVMNWDGFSLLRRVWELSPCSFSMIVSAERGDVGFAGVRLRVRCRSAWSCGEYRSQAAHRRLTRLTSRTWGPKWPPVTLGPQVPFW